MYTGLVSLTSLEIITNFMIVLTAIILVAFILLVRRMIVLKNDINALQQQNNALAASLKENAVVSATTSAPSTPVEPVPAAPVMEEVVPSIADDDSPSPEVVAAIVAAIESCGFSSSSIRSIRPYHTTRRSGWILAGRLANMR